MKVITLEPIMRHQQPSCQPLFDLAMSVGKRRVSGLNGKYVRITHEASWQRSTLLHETLQDGCADRPSMTRYLHEGFMRTAVRAKDGRNANHSLASDDGDLSPASCDTSDGDD